MKRAENLRAIAATIAGRLLPRRAASEPPAVLIVGNQETALLPASPEWRVLRVANLAGAERLLADGDVAVTVWDREASDLDWTCAVPLLARAPGRPLVLLLTASEDFELWERVTALGGYDVLRKPVAAAAWARAMRAALVRWRSDRALEGTPVAEGLRR